MSTNAQPRVLGRWCRTSRWCTLVHARRVFEAPADATSASCDVRSRDDSGRQRATAPEGSTVSGPQRPRTPTTAWRDVSEPQRRAPLRQRAARRQRAATSSAPRQSRNVKRATSNAQRQARNMGTALRQARNVGAALRQARNVKRGARSSAQTSA